MANAFLLLEADEELLDSGSFSSQEMNQIKGQNRQIVNGIDLPIPVALNLYETTTRKLDSVVNGIRRIYGNHCGIVSTCSEHFHYPGDPNCFEFNVAPSDKKYLQYGDKVMKGRNNGNAAGLTRNEALVAAVGELVERYGSSFYSREDVVFASYNQLAEAGIPATSPDSYPQMMSFKSVSEMVNTMHQPFTADAPGWWQWGQSLISNQHVLVPSIYCHLGFFLNSQVINGQRAFWDYSASTGLAAHSTLEQALLRSLYEVVERDALMLTWHNKLPSRGIRLEGATDPELLELMQSIIFDHGSWFITDITVDINITTCFGVYLSPDGTRPYSVVGAASDLNPQKAVARCLKELILGYTAMSQYTLTPPQTADDKALMQGDFSKCTDFHKHFCLFAAYDLREEMAFLSKQPSEWINVEDMPNRSTNTVLGDLRRGAEAFANAGLDVIALDMTSSDVAEAGFRLGRIIVPGAQPLDVDHNNRYLNSHRLREIKRRLGLADRDMGLKDFNPTPHPFP